MTKISALSGVPEPRPNPYRKTIMTRRSVIYDKLLYRDALRGIDNNTTAKWAIVEAVFYDRAYLLSKTGGR